MIRSLLFVLSFLAAQLLFAQIPAGYYDTATGTGDVLRANLRDIITAGHTKLPYTSSSFDVWDAYSFTDVTTSGGNVIWDMYTDIPGGTPIYTFTLYSDQCTGGSSGEGFCYSREHQMPNSWWGGFDDPSNPQYTDLHHLPPADQYVNQYKSNLIVAETSSPTYTSSNGSRVGPCSLTGFTGSVFEPINAYKGDFARAYLYMATRYMNNLSTWRNTYIYDSQYIIATSGGNYLQWYVDMLVRWHLQDPVSQKEIDRNNAIYYNTPQHNRNPYIDHPEFVCLVWSSTECNAVPIINNIVQTPLFPSPVNTVSITADITDDGSITSAVLQWCTDGTSFGNSIAMNLNGSPNYITSASIPAQTAGTTVTYKIIAVDNDGNSSTSAICSYNVLKPEPSNHATAFSCGTGTSTSITLTWTDATGTILPDKYLIKASNISLAAISDPIDGTPEADATYVKNIGAGIQSVSFTGLASATTYYFKIYPYTNSSSNVNYKTSPLAPENTCTTSSGGTSGCATDLIISEYIEGSSYNKYIEVFNGTGLSIDLSDYKLQLFSNGGATPSSEYQMSGTLADQAVVVYCNPSATIYTTNIVPTNTINFNGNDAFALYKISTASYVDIIGKIGENPVDAWTDGSNSTMNMTLVRNSDVISGVNTNPTAGFPTLATEWTAYATDDANYLGGHVINCPSVAAVSATAIPACETGSVTLTSSVSANQTFYLETGSGTPVANWTGTSDTHAFTGLASGTYQGYTVNGASTSPTSNTVTLTNDLISAGGTLSGPNTSICAGSNTGILTLSGYTGDITKWQKSNDGGTTWNNIINTDETWNEDISTIGTWLFMAEVVSGSCPAAYSNVFTIIVNPVVTPTFTQLGPYCVGETPAILETISTNGITGTWSPVAISTASAGTTIYTFVPTTGQCADTVTMTVLVNDNITPAFSQPGPYCTGETPATLPNTSTNGITGTWSPSVISTASAGTTTYTFTPTAGQCAPLATMNVTVYPTYVTLSEVEVCQGETYNWQGNTYATAGTYTKPYTSINGCDSIYILELTVNPTYSTSENQAICQGSTYTWHGTTYSSPGVYTKNYTTINGCDSTFTLNLTTIPTYAFSEDQSICEGETVTWQGTTYTTAGIYTKTYISSGGCDSTYTLNLEVNPEYSFTESHAICEGESYLWQGTAYTTAGTYTRTYTSINGCDSILTLNLTVYPSYYFIDDHSICQGETYTWQGNTYASAGTYTKAYTTIHGCDSIYTLNLTVYPEYEFSENHAVCQGSSYIWHGTTYSSPGTYTKTYTSINGCDSIYTLNLTQIPSYAFSEEQTICSGDSYLWHGNTYTTAGIYTADYISSGGCDSVYSLDLTVNPSYLFTKNDTICQGETYTWQGSVFTESGTYTKNYISIKGCDSTYILNLTVHPEYTINENYSICEGENYIWHGNTYSSSGIYTKHYFSVNGCDSIYTLNLTVNPTYVILNEVEVCNGESHIWRGNSYNVAGTYYDSLLTQSGCDSVFVLNLTVYPTYEFSESYTMCQGENYVWHGNNYTTAGTYTHNYTSINGCDSTYILDLTVYPSYGFFDMAEICEGDSYTWHGNIYSTAGTYTAEYTTVNGCDSIYTLQLTVHPTYSFSEEKSICQGSTWTWQGTTYSTAGTYIKNYTSIHGCDSIYTLNLSEVAAYSFIEYDSVCQGESYAWQGNSYSSAGTYTAVYTSSSGCDSTYTLHLSVNPTYLITETQSICEGQSYTWHGNTYSVAGTYTAAYTTMNGCDSIYTLNLSVNPNYVTLSEVEVCNGESYIWRGNSYNVAGTYYDSLLTQSGCDSVFVLNLTVNPTYAFNEDHSICQGSSYTWHGNTYSAAGTYIAAYTTVNGCDSIYTLNLSEVAAYSFNENHSICEGDSYTWHGNSYNTAGTYTATYVSVTGCDSIYTLNLTVNPAYSLHEDFSICEGDNYTWHGNTYSAAGTYIAAYTSINGCDSIYTLNLTVNPAYSIIESHSICDGDSYTWHGNTYSTAGTYTAAYTTVHGCDSTYTLNLTINPKYLTLNEAEVCNGESYIWRGNPYTVAGTYYDSLLTQTGCDSVFILNLTINPTYAMNESHEICQGSSYTWHGNTYSAAGTYTAAYTSLNGCDSIYTLNLIVHPAYYFNKNQAVCQGSSYSWQGSVYTAPGIYTKAYSSIHGCDSIYTLNLTEIESYAFSENHSMCEGDTYLWHGTTYTTPGIYSANYVSEGGCDSVYTLDLTVYPTYEFNESYTMCEGDSYTWKGTTYNSAGDYTKNYTSIHGCDSTYILHLNTYPSYSTDEYAAICEGENYSWRGNTYSIAGMYTKTYPTIHGCDSTFVLHLSINPTYEINENHAICQGSTYTWHGTTYSAPGTYTKAYSSINGCDSIYILHLTETPAYTFSEEYNICPGESYTWHGNTYSNAGIYTATYISSTGCDSVYTLNLNVNPEYSLTEDYSICDGDSLIWQGNSYKTAGTYIAAYSTINGCDSIYTLNLSINQTYLINESYSICQGSSYTWHGTTYTAPGVYTKFYNTINGCDSIYVLTLSEVAGYSFTENHSICTGDSYTWHGNTYDTSGTYTVSYVSSGGCDSIYTLNLTVNPTYVTTIEAEVCNSETYIWRGNPYTVAGTYYDSLITQAGCDSVFVLNLTVNPTYEFSENHSICEGDDYLWHGSTFTTNGIYYDSLQTQTGCDSVYILNLTVNPLPIVFLGNDTTICDDAFIVLDAGNTGATYLWSEGSATGQTIIVDSAGHGIGTFDVSVIVNNGCEASDTIAITIENCSSIGENEEIVFSVFPNPADGMIYIIQNGTATDAFIELTDATGKLLFREMYHNMNGSSQKKEFDLGVYPAGVYFLRIDNEVVRLVKQ
ncbi:MAG: endonuclease [Bacteroidales bacterium]